MGIAVTDPAQIIAQGLDHNRGQQQVAGGAEQGGGEHGVSDPTEGGRVKRPMRRFSCILRLAKPHAAP